MLDLYYLYTTWFEDLTSSYSNQDSVELVKGWTERSKEWSTVSRKRSLPVWFDAFHQKQNSSPGKGKSGTIGYLWKQMIIDSYLTVYVIYKQKTKLPNKQLDKRFEWTLHKRRHMNGQYAHEMMFNIISK